jgi:translation elongation factor EF-1alpha
MIFLLRGWDNRILAATVLGLLAFVGCSGKQNVPVTNPKQAGFSLTIEEIFYIGPPVDRVILVGTITEGSVRPGDSLVVKCQNTEVPVVVEAIEHPSGEMQKAERGQQVGLKLSGIRREQPAQGDLVIRKRSESKTRTNLSQMSGSMASSGHAFSMSRFRFWTTRP